MIRFRPDRVGHVCCLTAALRAQLSAAQIPIELCLSSNVITKSVPGYSEHHFRGFYLEGGQHSAIMNGMPMPCCSKRPNSCVCRPCTQKFEASKEVSGAFLSTGCGSQVQTVHAGACPVALCTDDCGVFDTSLSKELAIAAGAFSLSERELVALSHKAASLSFASDHQQARLQETFYQFSRQL